ncbi:glutathione S-transferase [Gilvimarinus algae]|uniref:Glutathione S-transferase n=1 Tax=Gilvimarinus algae TaxID=3058037 RepID=A0ABT8TJR1_9GAMM|nr:glutathione S-transferase [Gilvimarinus sp. SDUM040014]MDO3383603.1 glutathione S-transferase [Gilvimarinus sp. SDUM040014]
MELYGSYTSPFVRHCRIALAESGLDCEFVETDRAASAEKSPTKKVPFLRDDTLTLTDSTSILKYIREKSGRVFLEDVAEYDAFCLVNTSLDACVNLFFLELDGITTDRSDYLKRQKARVESTLSELNTMALAHQAPFNDMELRLGCYLAWGLYRQRFSIHAYDNLTHMLQALNNYEPFRDTAPPRL